jgi:hypothetical protein
VSCRRRIPACVERFKRDVMRGRHRRAPESATDRLENVRARGFLIDAGRGAPVVADHWPVEVDSGLRKWKLLKVCPPANCKAATGGTINWSSGNWQRTQTITAAGRLREPVKS